MAEISDWSIGLFEGEGCFTALHSRNYIQPVCKLVSTDEDVVTRFYEDMGYGSIRRDDWFKTNQGGKTQYTWHTYSRSDFERTAHLLAPNLRSRRRKKAQEILESVGMEAFENQDQPSTMEWATGLYEGEGCFSITHQKRENLPVYRQPRMKLSTTDFDVIEDFHQIVEVGQVRNELPALRRKNQKSWYAGSRKDLRVLIPKMLPLLGCRRSERAQELLDIC